MKTISIVFVTALNCLIAPANGQPAVPMPSAVVTPKATGDMHSLLRRIFTHYDKEVMPTRPVWVHLDVLLLRVKSTVEKEGIFESVVGLFINWYDSRMMWNVSQYDNISLLAFDSEKVWLPDIALTNSADHLYSISRDFRFVVRVTHDGHLKYVPTGTARTWCQLKLLTFPFDLQTCSLEFESWSLEADTLQFDQTASLVVDPSFGSNEWHLCSYTSTIYNHTYEFTGETFARIRFDFTVRRKSTFYMLNIVFPCATLSLIQLLVYIIPSTDTTSDRIGFGTTNLLTLVVFQTIATEEMPKTSDAVTSLSKYIIALIILASIGILESVIVERLLRILSKPPPQWVVTLVAWVPILWRETDGIEAEKCTDEILNKNLAALTSNTNRHGSSNSGGRSSATYGHQLRGRGSAIGGASNGSWFSRVFSRHFSGPRNSRRRRGTVARATFCEGYINSAEWSFAEQQAENPSPLWRPPVSRLSKHHEEEGIEEETEQDLVIDIENSSMKKNSMIEEVFDRHKNCDKEKGGDSPENDDDDDLLMENGEAQCDLVLINRRGRSGRSMAAIRQLQQCGTVARRNSSYVGNATRRASSFAVPGVVADLALNEAGAEFDFPETASQIEAAIARPSIMVKPAHQQRVMIASRRLQKERNARMWAEIVTKLDIVSFVVCTLSAILIPFMLFLPLLSDSECPDDAGMATHYEPDVKPT